jgi:CBS domain-containing protein
MSNQFKPESDAANFQDPLEDYDPKTYDDPLQRVLAEESVAAIQSTPFVSVSTQTTVEDAVNKLAELHVACLLVESEGKLVGVFTDRDVLNRVSLEYDELKKRPVSEVMTTEPVFVYDTDSAAAVLSVMAISGYRHVPVLSMNGTIVGIVSPQRVTAFLQRQLEGV